VNLLDLICTAVWHLRKSRIERAQERAKLGTWSQIAENYPSDIGRGPVRWSVR
jgi:hypothetical protein